MAVWNLPDIVPVDKVNGETTEDLVSDHKAYDGKERERKVEAVAEKKKRGNNVNKIGAQKSLPEKKVQKLRLRHLLCKG